MKCSKVHGSGRPVGGILQKAVAQNTRVVVRGLDGPKF
jgi:hypothetical protein